MSKLVRLRADPKKIKISVRRIESYFGFKYKATIVSLETKYSVSYTAEEAEDAIMMVYEIALMPKNRKHFDGLDPSFELSFSHPQYK